MKKLVAVVLFSVSLALAAAAENLLTNGTFDVPDTDFNSNNADTHWAGTGWTYWGNVFRQRWAARAAHAGGYFRGWAAADAGIYQNIPSTGGLHTLAAWVRREPAFSGLSNFEIKLEWMNATTNWVDTTAFGYYNTLPNDGLWHHIHVTATGTDANIAFIRPVLYCNWVVAGGAISFDDMELYHGPYTGAPPRLVNRSFEFYTTNGFRGTQWASPQDPLPNNAEVLDCPYWAARTGWRGLSMAGWDTNFATYSMEVGQNTAPGTGTYTFAVWFRREAGFLMTNAGLRLEWYDGTYTNQVSDSMTTNFTVPADTNWYEYYVTGNCTSPAVFEARTMIYCGWDRNYSDDNKSLRIDDARLFAGSYVKGPGRELGNLLTNVFFGNSSTLMPQQEGVPELGGMKFLEYSYEPDGQSFMYTIAPKDSLMGVRGRAFFAGGPGEIWADGTWYTNIVIYSTNQFHGAPLSGDVTMDVWRVGFYPPGNWQVSMWYSPAVRLAADGTEWWLANILNGITSGDTYTNNWPTNPQNFWNEVPYSHDWFYMPTGMISRYVTTDWAYINYTNRDPRTEVIPSWDGTSTFMQVNYDATSTTWYVLLEKPVKPLLPYEYSEVQLRTSWERPPAGSGQWVNNWTSMYWVTNLVLDESTPFHGLPGSGKHTVDLWRLVWTQPTNATGEADTNAIPVYFAPLIKVLFGSGYLEDERYLVSRIEGSTNGWGSNNYTDGPQYFGRDYENHDFVYINLWAGGFTDGIPNWWLVLYGLGRTNGVANGDDDNDSYLNIEEYAGDTVPTNNGSYFPRVTNSLSGDRSVMMLVVNPSSAARVYDAWWKTNLVDPAAWQGYGLAVPATAA